MKIHFSVNKFLLKIITLFVTVNVSVNSYAQLTVNNSQTPAQLVQSVLLGPGVTATNVTFTGTNISRGSFSGVSNLGLNSGVILATGNISVAPGPNNSGFASAGGSGAISNDPQLNAISTNTLYDAAILEFDFVPLSDTIKFRYVFGSEEYMEFAGSSYNDVFGFFISGPNPSGGAYTNQNIALIPNTTTPVTINNVNGNVNSTYYFNNEFPPGTSVQYDGFTVPLTATALVTCGETYHIKIAIADAGDGSYDSGVFLEAESFSSPGVSIIPEISYGGQNDSTLYEGCGTACILLVRGGALLTSDTVNIVVSGTAINGTDYYETTGGLGTPFPSQIIFAPGVDSVSFCITAAADVPGETLESIILTVPAHSVGLCVQPAVSTTIYLSEYTPISVSSISDTLLCNSLAGVVLNTTVTGGVQPYSYSWNNGLSSTANPTANPTANTSYIVTVNDACNDAPDPTPAVSDTVNVSIISIPAITANLSYQGTNDSVLYEGCGQACVYFVRTIGVNQAATFYLNVAGTAQNGADYTPAFPAQLSFALGQDSIFYCIQATVDGSGEISESIILNIDTVAGSCNLNSTKTLYINEYTPISIASINDTVLCNSLAGVVLNTTVTGGVQPYSYSWNNGLSSTANPTANPTANTSYIVTVNDACNDAPDPTPAVSDTVNVSIISIPAITANLSYQSTNDSVLYEGCGQACVYFVRTIGVTQAATFYLNTTGTAQNGVDYTPALPAQLSFAPGQDSIFYCIQAAVDGAGEILESIILNIDTVAGSCNLNSTKILYISEYTPISVASINDTVLCNSLGSISLNTIVTGGVQPYSYAWNNGLASIANPTANPTANTSYIVTVNDACNGTPDPTPPVSDTVEVSIVTIPLITATVSYQGSTSPIFYEGCGQACVYFVRTLGISQAVTFNLNVSGTAQNGTDYSPALPAQLSFAAGQDSVFYCFQATADGAGETPESILLTIDTTSGSCNLNATTALTINELAPISLNVFGDTTLNCLTGPVNIGVTPSGGLQPYVYTWSNGIGSVTSQIVTPPSTTTYSITVSDACNASTDPTPDVTETILVTVSIPDPIVVTASNDAIACPSDNIALSATVTGGALPITYLWSNIGPDSVLASSLLNTSVVAGATTVFTITATDMCGNSQADQVTVNVEENCLLNIPNVITPDGQGSVINETFYIENLNRYPAATLLIFNRFGNKIYESTSYQNNWSGSKYSDGTYFFILTVPAAGGVSAKVKADNKTDSYLETLNGTEKVYSGFFQIIRGK